MAGLETLDDAAPRDTDAVSLGDDSIRETRQKTKTSVGLEHYLDGVHHIPDMTNATRPAAGRTGRVMFNVTTKSMEYDNGTTWLGISDATARATILSHLSPFQVPSGVVRYEVPFDFVIDDPWNYGYMQYHQIIQPANSMGMVTAYLEYTPGPDAFGVTLAIEQFEPGLNSWQMLAQDHGGPTSFLNVATLVDSRWGVALRVTISNYTTKVLTFATSAGGRTPRFAYAMLGRTS